MVLCVEGGRLFMISHNVPPTVRLPVNILFGALVYAGWLWLTARGRMLAAYRVIRPREA